MLNRTDLEGYLGKAVYLKTISGITLTGYVLQITDDFLRILDKYGDQVLVSISDLKFIKNDRDSKPKGAE